MVEASLLDHFLLWACLISEEDLIPPMVQSIHTIQIFQTPEIIYPSVFFLVSFCDLEVTQLDALLEGLSIRLATFLLTRISIF